MYIKNKEKMNPNAYLFSSSLTVDIFVDFIGSGCSVVGINQGDNVRRKMWTFILLMACAVGIWIMFETTPTYVKGKVAGMEMQMTLKEAEESLKERVSKAKTSKSYEDVMVAVAAGKIARLPRYKHLDEIIFRSLPIIAFGVGIYLLFLRERKVEE